MPIFPKSANKPPLDTGYPNGSLIMYENDGVPLIGAVQAYRKQKYVILNERGREAELVAQRLHPLPGKLAPGLETIASKTEFLSKLRRASDQAARELNMEEVWEFVVDDAREFEVKELCELYHGKIDLDRYLPMRLALVSDRIYFKRNKDDFSPRPKESIEELRKAEAARQRKLAIEQATLGAFHARLTDRSYRFPPEVLPNIQLLEDLAAETQGIEPQRQKEARDLLNLSFEKLGIEATGNLEQRAYLLLERVGVFSPHTNLSLIRNRPPLEHSAAAVAAASALRVPATHAEYGDSAIRRDLTAWDAFTVDDATTRDMDDALSIERTASGYVLGIHISDVAALVIPDSLLDSEARKRATSIYCPDRTVNMFPEALSEGALSLLPGELRPCLSVILEIDQDYKVLSSAVTPSVIRSKRRLSYDEVDALLETEDPALGAIYNIAMTWQAERIERGAIRVSKRDAIVVMADDGSLKLVEIDEEGAARSTIGEMMVLANSVLARFAVEKGIPLIFRGQEPPDDEPFGSAAKIPQGPAFDYAVRSKLKRSSTSFSPIEHAGLGLSAYTQSTSPIRRYVDLCNQRQILEQLRTGTPLYSAEDLERVIMETDQALATANTVNKETKRFWLLKYLKQSAKERPVITGTVIRTDLKNPLVELDEVYIPVTTKPDRSVKLGDVLKLKIAVVDPRYDYLKLEMV